MTASRKPATGALLLALVACAALAVVGWSRIDGGGGAKSAGPVPGLPEENGQASASPGSAAGAVSLPPVGASPSMPEHGELLATLDARPGTRFPASFVPVHQVWVYSDGRVVWRREGGPYGVNGVTTGFLEQRLTPDGVELLRSELLSTGLFDRDGYYISEQGLSWGEIEVRNGDRLVSVAWCCPSLISGFDPGPDPQQDPTPQQTRALIRLSEALAEPASWLPTSAWEHPEITGYVPSRYAVCYRREFEQSGYFDMGRSLEPSRILSMLPAPAQDLLRGKDKRYVVFSSPAEHAACSEVTLEDARRLEEILTDAGFERSPQSPPLAATHRTHPDPIGTLFVSFESILPHGQWEAMGG